MNITKTIKKLIIAINGSVEEDARASVYEALLESFEEEDLADLEVTDLMGLCPYFDDVVVSSCPDLFDTGDYDEDEDGYVDSAFEDSWQDDSED